MKYRDDYDIIIQNNTISAAGTRQNSGLNGDIIQIGDEFVDVSSDEWENIESSEIIFALYEIKYLGNGKFTEPIREEIILTVGRLRKQIENSGKEDTPIINIFDEN